MCEKFCTTMLDHFTKTTPTFTKAGHKHFHQLGNPHSLIPSMKIVVNVEVYDIALVLGSFSVVYQPH